MESLKRLISILIFASLLISFELPAQEVIRIELSKRTVNIEGQPFFIHSVARKQTLFSIAKAYGVSEKSIKENNPFLGRELRAGSTLLIPNTLTNKPLVANKDKKQTHPTPNNHQSTTDHQEPATDQHLTDSNTSQNIKQDTILNTIAGHDIGLTKNIDLSRGVNISLLLPIGSERGNDINFVDFMNGALLATGRLADNGLKINLDIHSTKASADQANTLISSGKLDHADLIIGPVYDAPFETVGQWATDRHVPIVSPLGGSGSLDNPYVICLAPSDETRYDKLCAEIRSTDSSSNIVFIDCPGKMDDQMVSAMEKALPPTTRRLTYNGKATPITALSDLFMTDVKNIVILAVSDETLVEGILSRISSLNSASKFDISVIGTSRWARFNSMNLDLFFKLRVSYITSYHAISDNTSADEFTRQYLAAFGSIPNSYSLRGYDALMIFGRLVAQSGNRMLYDLSAFSPDALQAPYRFAQIGGHSSKFQNTEWSLVSYLPDYTITVK
ncbi:MAG: LysM peptidoglycan-binding domain-containing protein [Mucinivorans sp.]